jgi:MFS family permease
MTHRLPPAALILVLAVCLALQMTSFVMIMPLFARRLGDFGAGVEALGLSTLAYALAATLTAPFLGALADRLGRRPVVLLSLAAYAAAFLGYLLVQSAAAFILVRGLCGALTAGLIPAILGAVADIAPDDRRAQSIGIVNGGASFGWIAGPLVGGALYDRWGYVLPFGLAVVMALAALAFAALLLPETHPPIPTRAPAPTRVPVAGWRARLASAPRPAAAVLRVYAVLGAVAFSVLFAWAFIEPRLMFYVYDDLSWTSSQLGLAMSLYGLTVMLGEFGLGRLSDWFGRKPVLVLGLALFSAQFAGLVFSRQFGWIVAGFAVAGLGNALFDPALSALFLDLAPAAHKGRVMGLKSTFGSMGNLAGPALVVVLTPHLSAPRIFLVALILVGLITLLAGLALHVPARGRPAPLFRRPATP